MDPVHLDTHVVAWLYEAGPVLELLSKRARKRIEDAERLFISPMVQLELAFLAETGRIRANPHQIVLALSESVGLRTAPEPFGEVASEAIRLDWTRDPFDRLIAASALVAGADLVTRDRTIRKNLARATW